MPGEHDQLLRLRDGQGSEQHRIDDAEERRVGADAEREREQGDEREAFVLEQHPRPVAQVLKHFILQSLRLQPERIPKRAQAAPEQFEFVAGIESAPA